MQQKFTYPAVFEKSEDNIGVRFPDVPRGVSAGEDMEDARDMAKELLGLMLQDYMEKGEPLPVPGQIHEDLSPDETVENVTVTMEVTQETAAKEIVRISVYLPRELKESIQEAARRERRSMNELVVRYCQNHVQGESMEATVLSLVNRVGKLEKQLS